MKASYLNILSKLAIAIAALAILSGSEATAADRAARRHSVAGRGRLAAAATINHASVELLAYSGSGGYYYVHYGSRYGYGARYYRRGYYRPYYGHGRYYYDYGGSSYYGRHYLYRSRGRYGYGGRYYRPRYRRRFHRGRRG